MSSPSQRSSADALRGYVELATGDPLARADADMRYVLEAHAKLGGRSIEMCLPRQARQQPQLDAAIARLVAGQNRQAPVDDSVTTEDLTLTGGDGKIAARLYRPAATTADKALPVLLYFHGGGWVTGSLASSDATPRAMARKTGALVLSVAYRLAPEKKFPAAHDDGLAAWTWLRAKAGKLGGDSRKIALMGEGAGGNIALNIALHAREHRDPPPVHVVLISPMAGNDLKRPSYVENMRARPLSTPMVQWFVRHAFGTREETADPRINLCERADLAGLPPVTLILAEIDPLRSEGEALGEALVAAGVKLDAKTYAGVTHDFFGLGLLVNKAMFAQAHVAGNLRAAFAG